MDTFKSKDMIIRTNIFSIVLCPLLIILLSSNLAYAQLSAERQVLSTFGNQSESGSLIVTQTAGETLTTTLKGNLFTLTQGFQQWQGDDIPLLIQQLNRRINAIQIFPNPVEDHLMILLDIELPIALSFSLYDLHGKEFVHLNQTLESQGINELQFSMIDFPVGYYFLVLRNQLNEIVSHHVIQKVKL